MKNIFKPFMFLLAGTLAFTACSDADMTETNTDDTKASTLDPNNQLTTALLQTYGDFSLMDTYRSYITGFTQYYAGGWNVTNYAGSVFSSDGQSKLLWDRYYAIAVKNLVDAISRCEDKPNTLAALRIHRAYIMTILTDTYGDVPCLDAGKGYTEGVDFPKYDKQEDIYNWLFQELTESVALLGTGNDVITGDVTSLGKNTDAWKRYANSLRMRLAMRISDVNPEKARQEFEAAYNAGCILNAEDNAYVIHLNSPFTLYDGAADLDFRANALGEILYGQDPTSPTLVCATLFNALNETADPRLYRICRYLIHTTRSQTDTSGNFDVTDEVRDWFAAADKDPVPCLVGQAWWTDWQTAPSTSEIPTLAKLVEQYPEKGYDGNNFPARMIRPSLNPALQAANCPGILMTSAEVHFLLAEAALKGWTVDGSKESHYEAGVRDAMHMLNNYYDIQKISEDEINIYLSENGLGDNPKEAINYQAWILHLTNPSEGWANLRRSDYPALMDRRTIAKEPQSFTYNDNNLQTPTRLQYPNMEQSYNHEHWKEAVDRLGGSDNWHALLWWDKAEQNFYDAPKK